MIGIKKLDLYTLRKFLPLFAAAFFICLFVFMMQFTWRYVDELVGKGLSAAVLGQFFWYMGITLAPTALPLAVLLASLMTFGNMGEQLELLSMKAAGVPLVRIMRPLLLMTVLLTAGSFVFQNTAAPSAQRTLRTLIFSMKQSSPAVEIPEGVFYNGVPGINLYVERKNAATGMLYNVIIYKTDQGFDRAQIVLADSGRLEMTADKLNLKLELWKGEQFENLQQQNFSSSAAPNVPYDRETFQYKQFLIDFDSNFAMMDEEMLRDDPRSKGLEAIEQSVDSMNQRLDSIGRTYFKEITYKWYAAPQTSRDDSLAAAEAAALASMSYDSLVAREPADRTIQALRSAQAKVHSHQLDLEWKSVTTGDGDGFIRRHWVEWHQKFTLSLACLIFFFVGAPLGAIIRKGGLGMPAVISVLIFIFYYIINTSGTKLARDGTWNMAFGMWFSSLVLIPVGAVLTYKANKDSTVFNADLYVALVRRLLGLREKRNVVRKEVIIDDPDYAADAAALTRLATDAEQYVESERLLRAPNYWRLFTQPATDSRVADIVERMEALAADLANSRDGQVLGGVSQLPIIPPRAHLTPLPRRWMNVAALVVVPVGLVIWLRIGHMRVRLYRDLRQTAATARQLTARIEKLLGQQEQQSGEGEEARDDSSQQP